MAQNLKKLFSSISILFFLFFTGCISRQNNSQYTAPYSSYNTPNYETVPQQNIYKKRSPLHSPLYYEIQAMQRKQYIIPKHKINHESTFDKILRQSKQKRLKVKKIKRNSSIEDFPSNVPRGSVQ